MNVIRIIDKIVLRIIEGAIIFVLGFMLLGQLYQAIARNAWGGGIESLDILMRYGVVWLGLLGGVIAMRTGNQIRIDLMTKLSPPKVRRWLEPFTSLATVVICLLMAKASLSMIASESAAGTKLFGEHTVVPFLWIYPIGFSLIALQALIRSIYTAVTGKFEVPR